MAAVRESMGISALKVVARRDPAPEVRNLAKKKQRRRIGRYQNGSRGLPERRRRKPDKHTKEQSAILKGVFRPLTTCGIGQNIYLKPDGQAYPCYAWSGPHTCLGNAVEGNLREVHQSPKFAQLYACSVDTIRHCRDRAYRYLCGGACRAWGNRNTDDLNAPPPHCDHLHGWHSH